MNTKITVIVDNIPKEEILGEWGLSILVEYGDKKILADVGASNLFADNLLKLGFDIKDIDYGTLSHAHYDHSNGIPKFFEENEKAKFYIRETTDENCYFKKFFVSKYIGIPKNLMTKYADRIELVSGDYKLCEGVYLIPHKTKGLEKIGKKENMYKLTPKGWQADDFSHEQSLVLDTEKGLVIINCCSHGGAATIINEVKESFPDKHIYALIGGLHLFKKPEKEIRKISKEIQKTGIDMVCTGHCTRQRAYNIMKEELGEKVCQLKVGLELNF